MGELFACFHNNNYLLLFCIMLSQRQNQIENRNVDKRVEEYFNRLQSTNNTIIVTREGGAQSQKIF